MKKIILDSSAFFHGILNSFSEIEECIFLATPFIAEEIKSGISREKFSFLLRSKKLKIREPEKKYIEKIKNAIEEAGFIAMLSVADVSVLALAYEIKEKGEDCIIASNDFAIQNVASLLNLKFKAFSGEEIKEKISFTFICSGCRKEYKHYREICNICGAKVKKKMRI